MGSPLPSLAEHQFLERVRDVSPLPLAESSLRALYVHYLELQRWNPRLSLVGPGTAESVVERHYGESLAALPLIEESDRSLLDIGTGAGFPGLVLAASLPSLQVTLVEPRQRKWAFLKTAVRRCGLSCQCLDVRVGPSLPRGVPRGIDIITFRALTIPPGLLEALSGNSPRARFLLWSGAKLPQVPDGFRIGREQPLAESDHRRIVEIHGAHGARP